MGPDTATGARSFLGPAGAQAPGIAIRGVILGRSSPGAYRGTPPAGWSGQHRLPVIPLWLSYLVDALINTLSNPILDEKLNNDRTAATRDPGERHGR